MKNIMQLLGKMVILLVALAFLAGCSKGSATTSQSTPAPTTSASTSTSAAATTQAAGGALGDLLGKAAAIASMKYDMVTTAADGSVTTSTAWVKNKKMRVESNIQGQNTITLIDADAKTMYLYMPAQNTAMKMDFGQAAQAAPGNSISQYNPVIIGSETLDGKLCQILQYTVSGVVTKEWIWDAKGLPVRTQTTTALGVVTTDFKNYDFSDIADSQFVLPSGVQISSFGLPTGLPSGLPTSLPSGFPTALPSGFPTALPSGFPTALPSGFPTNLPTGLPK